MELNQSVTFKKKISFSFKLSSPILNYVLNMQSDGPNYDIIAYI